MKAKAIGYWVCTGLTVFAFLPGGIFYLIRAPEAVAGVLHLGYPMHFIPLLGVWKVLGAIAIVVPRFPVVKEWAYAGMMFDLTAAVVANAAADGGAFHIVAPIVVGLFVLGSWALRPESRRLKPA
jgi:hypothetical protein